VDRLVLWHRVVPPTRLENDDPAGLDAWVDRVEDAARSVGASTLARAGGMIALAFELTELEEALSLALRWLDEAETLHPDRQVAIGAATGEVTEGARASTGAAIDRAHLLAGRARKGELVVDAATRDLAGGVFLFDRAVGTGAAALRGVTLDRRMPRRAECRRAIARLRPAPVPSILERELASVAELARAASAACVLLRGPSGAGSSRFLLELERSLAPSFVARLGPVPGGLEPLGSLRLALRGRDLTGPLAELARGEVVERARLEEALLAAGGARPWFVLDPLAGLDAVSLEIVASVAARAPCFVVARAGMDLPLPRPLEHLPWSEHVVPSLRLDDAKEVARAILDDSDEDVVRRVAVLGGDTPLGVAEAARNLLAAGDVIRTDEGFAWRSAPRTGIRAIPLDTLVHERLDTLEGAARALLEACALAPLGTAPEVTLELARLDGVQRDVDGLRGQLESEAFLRPGSLAPTSEHLRRATLQSMPPARRAELERYLATALASHGDRGPLAEVTRGVSLAEGGDGPGAAVTFLVAARALAAKGWRDAARRLAIAAVQTDPRAETRAEATTLARSLGSERPPAEASERVSQVAVSALLAGDLGMVERTVDAAIAEGRDLAAADRVRAMAFLAKGDPARAMEVFERLARNTAREPRARARSALTLAWIRLHSGDASEAIRAALEALALVRRLKDPRGETAALHTLAACYRSLQRDADAQRLEDAAPA
jgi:tetratricopeptide (TPR) repeat protein